MKKREVIKLFIYILVFTVMSFVAIKYDTIEKKRIITEAIQEGLSQKFDKEIRITNGTTRRTKGNRSL